LTDKSLLGLAEAIVARAMAQRVPVFASLPYTFSQAGGLVTYSRDPNESFQATARLLKKILNGARPADLSVEQPTKLLLAINLSLGRPRRLKSAFPQHFSPAPTRCSNEVQLGRVIIALGPGAGCELVLRNEARTSKVGWTNSCIKLMQLSFQILIDQ